MQRDSRRHTTNGKEVESRQGEDHLEGIVVPEITNLSPEEGRREGLYQEGAHVDHINNNYELPDDDDDFDDDDDEVEEDLILGDEDELDDEDIDEVADVEIDDELDEDDIDEDDLVIDADDEEDDEDLI